MTRYALTLSVFFAALSGMSGCGLFYGLQSDDAEMEARKRERESHWAAYEAKYTTLVQTACDRYPAAFDASYEGCTMHPNNSTYCQPPELPQQRAMVSRFAECGLWAELFQRARRFPLFDSDPKASLWSELNQQHPLVDRFVEVLARTDALYVPPLGGDSADVFQKWLVLEAGAAACPRIAAHQQALGPSGQFGFTWFYYNAGCAEQALPLARGNLAHDHPDVRIQACVILGKFGNKGDADKLGLLALRDPFQREGDTQSGRRISVYPVRESCAAAANKLLLR